MQRFIAFCLLILLSSHVFAADKTDQPFNKRKDVKQFIDNMVKKHHFNRPKLNKLFSQVKVRPQVIKSIKKPLEANPWHTYQRLFVNQWRINNGVKFWNKHEKTLKRAEKKYGVDPAIIVATLGVETKYGQRTGGYRVIDSLSSIGFSDSRRAGFFRKELEEFLLLTREQKLDPLQVTGSYAGAIGQPQFMPSSYRYYAVDFSHDGKADLMKNTQDVIGSIANYYKKHGWKKDATVANKAAVIGKRYETLAKKHKVGKKIKAKDLAKYGIVSKPKIKNKNEMIRVIELDKQSNNKEYWLGHKNFEVIRRYNPNDLYAMAVFQLSEYIKELRNGISTNTKSKKQ